MSRTDGFFFLCVGQANEIKRMFTLPIAVYMLGKKNQRHMRNVKSFIQRRCESGNRKSLDLGDVAWWTLLVS